MEEAFNIISEFKLFIAARFHANIIAQLLEVPILPVIYSNKTSNMLRDINLDSIMISMENLSKLYNKEVIKKAFSNMADLNEVTINSKAQFKKLSLFIKE